MSKKTRTLCEAAVMIALAQILSFIRIYRFPDGGSVDPSMLPILVFAIRAGMGWGLGAGIVSGLLQYVLGQGISIDWTSLIVDYLVANAVMGFGAGVGWHFRRGGLVWGTLIGCALRFLAHFLVGVYVWGVYMPESFLGLELHSTWIYSLLYNGSYMAVNTLLCLVLILLLGKYVPKYVRAGCLEGEG